MICPRLKIVRTLGFRPVCVCLSVKRDLITARMDRFEILGDVRGKKYKNRHTAAFLKNVLVFSKTTHLLQKRIFCTLQKNGSKDLSKTLTKCRGNCLL